MIHKNFLLNEIMLGYAASLALPQDYMGKMYTLAFFIKLSDLKIFFKV